MFGDNFDVYKDEDDKYSGVQVQRENTPFSPMSPYAVAKTAAHQLVNNYRKAYGLHASCGILFNHEGPRRGEEFLTQKVCNYVARLKKHMEIPHPIIPERPAFPKLKLGNLESFRDFGFAGDYVKAMHLMLQQETPDDYVIATGETTQIKMYVAKAFDYIGELWTRWVDIDKNLVRPSEVDYLLGDARKAKEKLGWAPTVDLDGLIKMTVDDAYAKL
jgi:GDPmannose 4,6-dehydratase